MTTGVDDVNLQEEAVLAADIQFERPITARATNPEAIFLTGATGFLGAYLLAEFMHSTSTTAYCLIRAQNEAAGRQRLQNYLEFYKLWDSSWSDRVIPVLGDLAYPLLNLSETQFEHLATSVDGIYHSAASVQLTRSYAELKQINVLGTQEIIRLAGRIKTKPLHFISTLGLFFGQGTPATGPFLETDFPDLKSLKVGYKQTKVVAELLIQEAEKRGLPACIYRPGRITGHSQTGIIDLDTNIKDFLFVMSIACVQMQAFPVVEELIEAAPVDYFSRAILQVSCQKSSFNKVFHLLNAQPITWQDLRDETVKLGYVLEPLSPEDWLRKFANLGKTSIPPKLYNLLNNVFQARKNHLFPQKPHCDDLNTRKALESIPGAYPPPILNGKLLGVYFDYFYRQGAVSQKPLFSQE